MEARGAEAEGVRLLFRRHRASREHLEVGATYTAVYKDSVANSVWREPRAQGPELAPGAAGEEDSACQNESRR